MDGLKVCSDLRSRHDGRYTQARSSSIENAVERASDPADDARPRRVGRLDEIRIVIHGFQKTAKRRSRSAENGQRVLRLSERLQRSGLDIVEDAIPRGDVVL